MLIVYSMTTRVRTMKEAAINLRALPEQRDLIDQAARLLGKNRSDFMLEVACERAQAVLLDQTFFRLDADRFQRFNELLDAPAVTDDAARKLLRLKPVWED